MNWSQFFTEETTKPYYKDLYAFVMQEYQSTTCYPPPELILNAFATTPFEHVKCVILGQDPYHGENQAMGLSFSVPRGTKIPPSLRNIYSELKSEYGYELPTHGDLTKWAEQGVLLLNSVLSVRAHNASSHAEHGWEIYTDNAIKVLSDKESPIVFMLWGRYARNKKALITNERHLVLESAHPSPYSAGHGFFGNGHFKKCNEFLISNGIEPIDWQIK